MATSNKLRALNRLPYDFQDGLKVGGVDVTALNQTFTPAGAGLVGFTPVGNLSAGNVQAALAELESEKVGFARLDDTDGSSLVGYDGGTVQDVLDALTGPTGAASVGYTPVGIGAVATNVHKKLLESCSAVTDFGADNTGVNNSTTALLNFFTHCINTGTPGHIPAGEYLVTPGVLAFDNGHTDKAWPNITTDGYGAVTLKRASAADAPMISITNGTAVSAVAKTWRGGILGGMSFDQNGHNTATNQHGLLLRGIVRCSFGRMRGVGLGGSTIHIEKKLYGGSNPDPYNVASCYFDAVEGQSNKGASFWNDNYVGLTNCVIGAVRAIENEGGAFYGFGSSNQIGAMSVGSCKGWALGNPPPTDVAGGAASRFRLGVAEFDDVQYGIDMRTVTASDFGSVRFVHRYNFGPLNPGEGYWPRIAIQCAVTRAVSMNNLKIIDRIEAGGTKLDLGQFFDLGNAGANLSNIKVQRQILDNAGFGITTADYYSNLNPNTTIEYTENRGYPVIDTLKKAYVIARAQTTYAVPSGGYPTVATNTVAYDTELIDPSGSFDPATFVYTCRSYGVYRVAARIVLAVPIGTRIRMAVIQNGTIVANARFHYATTADAQGYDIDCEVVCSAGTTIQIVADQNSAGAVNLSFMGTSSENRLYIGPV